MALRLTEKQKEIVRLGRRVERGIELCRKLGGGDPRLRDAVARLKADEVSGGYVTEEQNR